MFRDSVTIYNQYSVGGIERWHRTVLKGVYWNANRGSVLRKTGASSADAVTIIIPHSVGVGYKKPKVWSALADKTGSWTLQPGDTVVLGNLTVEIAHSAAKELDGHDDVLVVTNVDDKAFGGAMAHWEVSGK